MNNMIELNTLEVQEVNGGSVILTVFVAGVIYGFVSAL